MPSFVEDPAQLSKRRLRSELAAHSVPLPAADSGKEAYVELYRRHVAARPGADFSSDEDEGRGQAGGSGTLTRNEISTQPGRPFHHAFLMPLVPFSKEEASIQDEGQNKELEVMDVSQLTDMELKARLLQYGVNVGPIVASTRTLYEKKLRILLKPVSQPPLNGAGYAAQYSDVEDDDDDDDDADDEERDYGSGGHLEADEEQDQEGDSQGLMKDKNATRKSPAFSPKPSVFRPQLKEPVGDILMEMFPGTERTPTGISATCRRPIKGAAGRPVQYKYPDTPSSPATKERRELQRHLVPTWIQMLVFLLVAFLFYLIFSAMQGALDSPSAVLLDRSGHEGELLGDLSPFATSEDPPLVSGEE